MKLIKDPKTGEWSVRLSGAKHAMRLHTTDAVLAGQLVETADLRRIEILAKAGALSASAVKQLGGTGRKMFITVYGEWQGWLKSQDLSPKTIREYASCVRNWIAWNSAEFKRIGELNEEAIDSWVNAEDGLSLSTKTIRFAAISSFCRFCSGKGYTPGNVADLCCVKKRGLHFSQKEPKAREIFTEDELARLYQVDHPFWSVAIRLANEYGLRLSDCCLIGADQVRDGRLIVWMEKTQTRITMPFSIGLPSGTPCFPEIAETYNSIESRGAISARFSGLLRRLRIEGKSFHCFRHTFATRHAALGATIDEIRMKLGHADETVTRLYIHGS